MEIGRQGIVGNGGASRVWKGELIWLFYPFSLIFLPILGLNSAISPVPLYGEPFAPPVENPQV